MTGWRLLFVGLWLASTQSAMAQSNTNMADCKASIMGALTGEAPMPEPPMPMPGFKPDAPMATGMAPPAAKAGDVGAKAAVQDKCMDKVLPAEQSEMDKKK